MFLRHEARAALVTAIDAQTTAKVTLDLSVPDAQADQVWVAHASGQVDHNLMAAATLPRDDLFEVNVLMRSGAAGQSATQASANTQTLLNAVVEAIRGATLSDLSVTTGTGTARVLSAVLGRVDGPYTEPSDEGFVGYAVASVNVHSRSQYL